jgi:hypothetical protein
VITTYKELVDKFEEIPLLIENRIKQELKAELDPDTKYLLLIDALDEKMIDVEEQVDALSRLVASSKQLLNLKIVITSRYLVGLDRTSDLENEITRLELAPLTMKQTIDFLTQLCTHLNIASRIIEDLKKSQLLRELPRSPIAAILLAKLINENPEDLPSSLTELYSQYIELILGRWEIEKGLKSQKEYKALDSIMEILATYIMDNELPCISSEEVRGIVQTYLKERNFDINPSDLFENMVSRCDLLSHDIQSNTICFKHRTFAEFFYAKTLEKSGLPNIEKRAFTLYWMNTIFFYLGILKDCPDLLEKLADYLPDSEGERWLKLINMPNYMLASYATPYKIISNTAQKELIEASKLYLDIISGKIVSPFQSFSQMSLLYLMQYVIRESYSFDFFKKAIEDAALAIEDGSTENTIKAYALFFLNVAYIELGAEETFDFLLKSHSKDLPLDLSLAVENESKNLKERTALMRKQDRRIKHLLKNNSPLANQILKSKSPLADQIKKLYESPIRLLPSPESKVVNNS